MQQVGMLAYPVALAYSCSAEEARVIGLAGQLYDIGMIAVPDQVLGKSASRRRRPYGRWRSLFERIMSALMGKIIPIRF
jgi:response regulator RpfG family c-di-GMP phosphodiesterase